MKKLFTILVSLLVTASVYSQTYKIDTYYPELGGYVIQFYDTDHTHGLVIPAEDQGTRTDWKGANSLISNADNYNSDGAKFNDWRLPLASDIKIMCEAYARNNLKGINFANLWLDGYWTREENVGYWISWMTGSGNFDDIKCVDQRIVGKETLINVRAVRDF